MDEKKCPFDSKLECRDCRLFVLSELIGDTVLRCTFDLIRGGVRGASLAQVGAGIRMGGS